MRQLYCQTLIRQRIEFGFLSLHVFECFHFSVEIVGLFANAHSRTGVVVVDPTRYKSSKALQVLLQKPRDFLLLLRQLQTGIIVRAKSRFSREE